MSFPSLLDQIADKCVHFTGTMHPTCKAGVKYEDIAVNHAPIQYQRSEGPVYTSTRSMPCNHGLNHCGATCDSARFLTPDEAELTEKRQRAEMEESTRHIFATRAAIVAAHGPWKRGTASAHGIMPCPKCGADLHWSRAGYNGHIWGRCVNSGCLGWME